MFYLGGRIEGTIRIEIKAEMEAEKEVIKVALTMGTTITAIITITDLRLTTSTRELTTGTRRGTGVRWTTRTPSMTTTTITTGEQGRDSKETGVQKIRKRTMWT